MNHLYRTKTNGRPKAPIDVKELNQILRDFENGVTAESIGERANLTKSQVFRKIREARVLRLKPQNE